MAKTTLVGPDGNEYTITHPDDATEAEILSYARENHQTVASPDPSPEYYEIPYFPSATDKPDALEVEKDRSIEDVVAGAAETGLTALTGATGGTLGMIGGTIEGIGKSVAEGKYGTQQGAREAQETAMKRAGQLTYQPRTETGQEFLETIGEVTENIPVVPLLAPEIAALRSGIRGAQAAPMYANQARTKIKSLISRERPEVQVFTPGGELTQEAMSVIRQNNLEPQVRNLWTPEQAENYNLFLNYGVRPTRADVTQSVSDKREQREALKEDSPVVDEVAEQERQIRGVIEGQADQLGGAELNRDAVGSRIFEPIREFTRRSDDAINAAYEEARRQGRADGRVVTAGDIAQTVISHKKSDFSLGGVVSRVENILEDQGIIKENDNGKMKITNKRLSVDEAENIRKRLVQIEGSTKPGPEGGEQRRFIRTLKNAIDNDVERAVGSDIFAEARAEKTRFERVVERDKRDKRDIAKRELLRDIISNKIPEDKIAEKLLSADKESFREVRNFLLSTNGGEAGRQAFDVFKAFVLRDMMNKSLNQGSTVGGEPTFNPRKLSTEVDKLSRNKYDLIFSPEERQIIDDIIRIGRLREPDQAVKSGRGPSSFALTALLRTPWIRRFPVLGEWINDVADDYAARRRDARLLDPLSGVERTVQRAASRQQAPSTQ